MKILSDNDCSILAMTVSKCEECRHPFSDEIIEHYPECRYFSSEKADEEEERIQETLHDMRTETERVGNI
jgi:hypothetical protein